MADDSVSAIDDKNNTEDTTSTDTSDWRGFSISVFWNFFWYLFLVLIGSNFIFLVNFNALDIVFPTEIDQYLPHIGKRMKGGNANRTTYARKWCENSVDVLKTFGYKHHLTGWPYSMYDKNAAPLTPQEALNWFALTEADTFILFRSLMRKVYGSAIFKIIPEPLLYLMTIFLSSTLVFPILSTVVIFFIALLSTPFYALISEKMGVVLFFLGWWIIIPMLLIPGIINGWIQCSSLWFNLLITPLILNYGSVFAIAKKNSKWLTIGFGIYILQSAYLFLNTTASSCMTFAYIIWVIKILFFNSNKKQQKE